MDNFKINARGTIIETSEDTVKNSPVIKKHLWNGWKKEQIYFLDWQPSTVHKALNHLTGRSIECDTDTELFGS